MGKKRENWHGDRKQRNGGAGSDFKEKKPDFYSLELRLKRDEHREKKCCGEGTFLNIP